jgi:phosphate transport system permease protein
VSSRVTAVPSTHPLPVRRRIGDRFGDVFLHGLTGAAAAAAAVLLGGIAWKVFDLAWPAITKFGFGFLTSQNWDAIHNKFGALDLIWGTLLTSFGALVLAVPLSIAIGLYLSELAPRGARTVIASLVELLAAIPSVVLGLWGILVLGPIVGQNIEPWLHRHLGFIPLFGGSPENSGMLVAILVLTIMVVPITSTICRELFLGVPTELEQGALALGATRWEMLRMSVLKRSTAGIFGASLLGLGRAFGETIAVTMLIGNSVLSITTSIFGQGATMPSVIANEFTEATEPFHLDALFVVATVLLIITLLVNVLGKLVVSRISETIA